MPSLAVEVLQEILFHALLPNSSGEIELCVRIQGPLPPQYTLMAVCHVWRALVMRKQDAWKNITVDGRCGGAELIISNEKWTSLLIAFYGALRNSQNQPLTIALFWDIDDVDASSAGRSLPRFTRCVDLAVETCMRWRVFSLENSCSSGGILTFPFACLYPIAHKLPLLESIRIVGCGMHPEDLRGGYYNIFEDAPRLRRVVLDTCIFDQFEFPWEQLDLVNLPGDIFETYNHFILAYNHVMRRTSASEAVWTARGPKAEHTMATAASIPFVGYNRRVKVLHLDDPVIPSSVLFPSLIDLTVSYGLHTAITVGYLVRKSRCKLENLTLRRLHGSLQFPTDHDLRRLCTRLSSLRRFEWEDKTRNLWDLGRLLLFILPIFALPQLPKLREISISMMCYKQKANHHAKFILEHGSAVALWEIVHTRMNPNSSHTASSNPASLRSISIRIGVSHPARLLSADIDIDGFLSSPALSNIRGAVSRGCDVRLEVHSKCFSRPE